MPRQHVFHEIYLHLNWHCHNDRPLISPEMEPALTEYIRDYCGKVPGVFLLELGGTETHLHLAVQVEPTVQVAEFVGKVKGASAHSMNKEFGKESLQWQRGYGVVSFAGKNLEGVLDYIRHQKEHHGTGDIREKLEWMGAMDGETEAEAR